MGSSPHIDDHELRELLHLVSHDIRNPLAAIVTNLEFARRLVIDDGVDLDLRESVEDSVIACEVLKRVVANFDILAKGKDVSLSVGEVAIAATIRDVAKRCRERADQAGLSLAFNDGGVDDKALLDKQLFSLILENLISNSVQHGPRGSEVVIELARGDEQLVVTVTDQGKAVPAEYRERALSVESHTPKGRQGPTRYGRGLSMLAAATASKIVGVELAISGEDGAFEMRLTIPLPDTSGA
jgi:signal transduction histidine kinase